ncbi:MAG TPA: hypothetical protein VN655_06525 [Pseudolabrys sp.]|jgi:hypothetical protein|nr:hypothetical protein [Pseudolabrys sp.]
MSIIGAGGASNWLAGAFTAIKNSQNQGGILGALQKAGSNDGSIGSFLSQSSSFSNTFALITSNNVSSASSFYAQIASQNDQARQQKQLQDALTALQQTQQQVQPTNTLDPFIYFADGSYIDTNSNILTMQDGTQFDTTTGLKYVDPASMVDLGGGSFLNTNTNVITLADGTQIDATTGIKVT